MSTIAIFEGASLLASYDHVRFDEQLNDTRAPKKENGSGAEPPKPLYLN
jgi:hypothetical protein